MSGDEAFDALVGRLDYPMVVVTTAVGDERAGCLVGFTTQCSIDPPRFLACLSDKNATYRLAQRASHLAVHVLPADRRDLAALFGGTTGDETDKFSRCAWTDGPGGVPVLDGAAGWFAGEILDRVPFGDHVGFLLAPVDGAVAGEKRALLTFRDVRDLDPGHDA